MTVGSFLVAVDATVMRGFQWVYDWAWDRYGLYVGTFRAAVISAAFGVDALISFLVAPGGPNLFNFVAAIGYTLIAALMVAIVFLRQHLGPEWRNQDAGRYDVLNKRAMLAHGGTAAAFRLLLFVVLMGLSLAFGLDRPLTTLEGTPRIVLIVGWVYANGVLVRARREQAAAPSIQGSTSS